MAWWSSINFQEAMVRAAAQRLRELNPGVTAVETAPTTTLEAERELQRLAAGVPGAPGPGSTSNSPPEPV